MIVVTLMYLLQKFQDEYKRGSLPSRIILMHLQPFQFPFYFFNLTFILLGRPIENKFSFTTVTWPR